MVFITLAHVETDRLFWQWVHHRSVSHNRRNSSSESSRDPFYYELLLCEFLWLAAIVAAETIRIRKQTKKTRWIFAIAIRLSFSSQVLSVNTTTNSGTCRWSCHKRSSEAMNVTLTFRNKRVNLSEGTNVQKEFRLFATFAHLLYVFDIKR